jgi:hypothetical protein
VPTVVLVVTTGGLAFVTFDTLEFIRLCPVATVQLLLYVPKALVFSAGIVKSF